MDEESKLKAEVCLALPGGADLWVVPEYTVKNGDERFELSMSDLGVILRVVEFFEVKAATILNAGPGKQLDLLARLAKEEKAAKPTKK